jgi:RimJ/RimL family protein N-acetyltransferase
VHVLLRPTRPDDIENPLPCRVQALTGEIDGRVIGVGGLAFLPGGTVAAWADLSDEARRAKISLHKAALEILRMAQASGIKRIVASGDVSSPAAMRWLIRLGFEPTQDEAAPGHPIFIWHNTTRRGGR